MFFYFIIITDYRIRKSYEVLFYTRQNISLLCNSQVDLRRHYWSLHDTRRLLASYYAGHETAWWYYFIYFNLFIYLYFYLATLLVTHWHNVVQHEYKKNVTTILKLMQHQLHIQFQHIFWTLTYINCNRVLYLLILRCTINHIFSIIVLAYSVHCVS